MIDQQLTYCLAGLIGVVVALGVFRRSFDPFAPIWLFLLGYLQVYVVQAINCRDYALRVRGQDLVTAANGRALWALAWFLVVYYSGLGKWIASWLPRPAAGWSTRAAVGLAPLLIVWGLACAVLVFHGDDITNVSPEEVLLRSFPMLTLVGANVLIVTGRNPANPRPVLVAIGLGIALLYIMLWMILGRRTPPLFGVLATVCAFYVSRRKRPPKLVLAATALVGILVVSLAIGFRNTRNYEQSLSGFLQYAVDFRIDQVMQSLNLDGDEEDQETKPELATRETWEYGGFLLMMDTVPEKADFDYGASYLRLISTYIPRIVWQNKPLFGREQWLAAWQAGSEFKRKDDFTGPAIGILGATQLNGGATGTVIVLGLLALLLRTSYEFFRRHETCPWAQVWWSLTYYNAWLMTVNDDPFVWFYYVYGHTVLPPMLLFWIINKLAAPAQSSVTMVVPEGTTWQVEPTS
jgi:hypothetical protein